MQQYEFKNYLTEDYIISQVSEKQMMEYYLGIPVKKGLFKSPLREDKHPSCSYFIHTSGRLMFHDFATNQCLTVVGVVRQMYGCDYHTALQKIADDFGIEKTNMDLKPVILQTPNIDVVNKITDIKIQEKEFTKDELKWWFKYNINRDILYKYDVHSCKCVFYNNNIISVSSNTNYIFGYYGGAVKNLQFWRCYSPMKREKRFISNWNKNMIQGYNQLPDGATYLVITKSMKDCMAFDSFNIPAIAPCSETLFISDKILNNLCKRFKYIVVMYDNDRAGKVNMYKIRKQYPNLNYFIIPREYNVKDFSDMVVAYGKSRTQSYISNFKKWFVFDT